MSGDTYININGYIWMDATDRTVCGAIYPLEDVIRCGGKEPDFISCGESNEEENQNS